MTVSRVDRRRRHRPIGAIISLLVSVSAGACVAGPLSYVRDEARFSAHGLSLGAPRGDRVAIVAAKPERAAR